MERLIPTVLILSLCGCAGGGAMRLPELEVPESWSEESLDGELSDAWWRDLGDPRLDELIELAHARNGDLEAAASRVRASEAQARIAGAALRPSVGVSLDGQRNKRVLFGFPFPTTSITTTAYGLSLNTRWEADLWGRLSAGKKAAVAESRAQEIDLTGARLSLAGQVAKAWFSVLEAEGQRTLAAENLASLRTVAERVGSRYRAGLRPAIDLKLALNDLAVAEADVERREDRLRRLTLQLQTLVGEYPDGRQIAEVGLPAPAGTVPAGLPADLVDRRPDLVAARYRLLAADQRFLAARRALYPSLTLTAAGGSSSDELKDLVDGDFSVWSLAAGLLQPVFQGGRLRAGVDRAAAERDAVVAGYVQDALEAYAEVEAALSSEGRLRAEEEALGRAAALARDTERLAEERYVAGLIDIFSLLETRRRAVASESRWLEVRLRRLTTRIDLYLALGGGFRPAVQESAS